MSIPTHAGDVGSMQKSASNIPCHVHMPKLAHLGNHFLAHLITPKLAETTLLFCRVTDVPFVVWQNGTMSQNRQKRHSRIDTLAATCCGGRVGACIASFPDLLQLQFWTFGQYASDQKVAILQYATCRYLGLGLIYEAGFCTIVISMNVHFAVG